VLVRICLECLSRRLAVVGLSLALLLVGFLAMGSHASPIAAQRGEAPTQLVGQLGGPSMAVAIQGETLYLGVGPRVAVFDISDPSAPAWKTSGPILEGLVREIVLGDSHLYVATDPDRIEVFTIEDDGLLSSRSSVELQIGSPANDLALDEDTLFVAVDGAGVMTIDVSDPALPSLLGELDAEVNGQRLAVTAKRLHLLDDEGRLNLIERGAGGSLSISQTLEAEATEITLAGDTLALVHLDQQLRTYDLQDIAALMPLAETELALAAASMASDGRLLYVGTIGGSIQVFDTTDPATLAPVAEFSGAKGLVGTRVEDMAFHQGEVFAAARIGPALANAPVLHAAGALLHNPVDGLLQQWRIPSVLIDQVEVTGRTAWIAEGFSADEHHLTPVDLVDPSALRVKPELPLDSGTEILAMAGSADRLYVRSNQSLLVVDGATAELKHTTFKPRGSGNGPMRLWHGLLVICSGTDLSVFDVSQPDEPQQLGDYLGLPSEATGLEISADGVAYITFEKGWALVSLRDPSQSQIVRGSAEGGADELASDGARFFSLLGRELRSLEPRGLRTPLERWQHSLSGLSSDPIIALGATDLFALDREAQLTVFDLGGSIPIVRDSVPAPRMPLTPSLNKGEGGLALAGDHLLAAAPEVGLLSYRLSEALDPAARDDLSNEIFLPRVMRSFATPTEPTRLVFDHLGAWRSLDDVSSIGLAVSAGRAYVGLSDADGAYVAILDLADPGRPRLLGRSPALDGVIDAIAVEGGRAYVASAGRVNAMHVLDVSNPSAPVPMGRIGLNGRGWKMIAQGGRVYISRPESVSPALFHVAAPPRAPDAIREDDRVEADSCSGRGVFCIVDASDPNLPRVVGNIDPGPDGDIAGFDLVGTRLVAADLKMGLRVFDVGNPAAPVELGRFDAGAGQARWSPHDLSFDGRIGTVISRGGDEGFEGVWVVDLLNPAQPEELGSVGGMEDDGAQIGGWFIQTEGTTAFVRSSSSVLAFDVGEPAFPRLLNEYDLEITRGRIGLAVENGFAYTLSILGMESLRLIEP
jgi:hypothetical protein